MKKVLVFQIILQLTYPELEFICLVSLASDGPVPAAVKWVPCICQVGFSCQQKTGHRADEIKLRMTCRKQNQEH